MAHQAFSLQWAQKMSIRPNNQKLFMWMSHFCYWFEAVMGGRHWSLRPNAFRKWHFIFSDDFFFFRLTTVWNRTAAKLLIISVICFIYWKMTPFQIPETQHSKCVFMLEQSHLINHSEMQQQSTIQSFFTFWVTKSWELLQSTTATSLKNTP